MRITLNHILITVFLLFTSINSFAGGYSWSECIQGSTAAVVPSATDQLILGVRVRAGTGGGNCTVTQIQFTMQNTNDVDVASAKLYYTGGSAIFSTATQVGATVNNPNGTISFTVSIPNFSNSFRYFWLTFDMASSFSNPCVNTVDAFVPTNGITITGTGAGLKTPITNNPAGNRQTTGIGCWQYCTPGALSCVFNDKITRIRFGTLDNNSGATCTGGYSDYSGIAPPTLIVGTSNNLIMNVSNGTGLHSAGVWIDYNRNGSFLDPGEFTSLGQNTIAPSSQTTVPILIPTTALTGTTGMRIQYAYGSAVLSSWTCFTNATWGETEDYTVDIQCGATPSDVTGRFPANTLALPCGAAANLTWDTHTCATGFKVYMDTNPAPTTLVQNSTATSYYTGNLLSNTTYYWKVVPYNGTGDGASSTWSFVTQTAINVAISQDSSACASAGICLEASGGAFPDYFWYDISVGGSPVGTGTTYCPPGLTSTDTFYVSNILLGPANSIATSPSTNALCGGGFLGKGQFFDVKAKSANITITSLDAMFESNGVNPAAGTSMRAVKIYYRAQSYVGFTASAAGWTLLDNLSISVVNTPSVVTAINNTDLFIPAGATYGMYVVFDNAIQTGAALFSNVDLEVSCGSVSCGATEFGTIYNDFSFQGNVYYNISCSSPTVPVIATPWNQADNVELALSSVTNAVEQCTELGWTYYADPAVPLEWLFAIKKNASTYTAVVDIIESPSVYSNINAAALSGSFLISRYWNVRVTSGTVTTPQDVRFFFDTAEVRPALDMRNFQRTTNYPTSVNTAWRWFKSVGADFDPAVGISGNLFTFPNITLTAVPNFNLLGAIYSGWINGVAYAEFTAIPSFSGGTGGFGFTPSAGAALPVELLTFNAESNESTVNLVWSTATEINNHHFTVERSQDGIVFEFVGVKDGAGNSNSILNYNLVDENPFDGTSYYRLKQTDNNGEFTYSDIVSVDRTIQFGGLTVYPNPVKGLAYLSFNSTTISTLAVVTIYDISGRKILTQDYLTQKGDNRFVLSTEDLTQGMYFLTISIGLENTTVKFIKD